jgi:predicted transcriptional regulator of viral defense system
MSAASDLASLRAMGEPLVRTRDAAVRLGVTESAASHLLRRTANAGLIRPIRRGLWALDLDVDPMQLAPYLTAPYPSYVSLWSALHAHGMLSQIPRETHVVSLGRPGRIATSLGKVVVHQLAPDAFGGYETGRGIQLATPTKALFDLLYLSAANGRFRSLPEIDLDRGYEPKEARSWVEKLPSARIRAIILKRLRALEGPRRGAVARIRPKGRP